jgi:lipopolysaccharide/colanic/teichoic acid biosynthesis glycosyltransferase
MTLVAIAIRLDSPGPVLYGQWRTGHLGEPFQLLKFRSMVSDAEASSGPRLSDEDAGGVDPRVTRIGRVLRATHLDELPQLFSILVGEMSVVGPRPERPALDAEIAAERVAWRRRWFLTPGLTGLAQINDVTGYHPEEKLAYDLEYADRRSLALDVRIIAIQLGQVAGDVLDLFARRVR